MNGITGKGVDHHIDTGPFGQFHYLFGKIFLTVIDQVSDAQAPQVVQFFFGSGGAIYIGADSPSHLDGRQAGPPGRRLNQDPIAFRHLAHFKGVVHGQIDHGKCAGRLKSDMLRFLNYQPFIHVGHGTMPPHGPCGHSDDIIPFPNPGHVFAGLHDLTGDLESRNERVLRHGGVQAFDTQQVAEIQSKCFYQDLNFPVSGSRGLYGEQPNIVGTSGFR